MRLAVLIVALIVFGCAASPRTPAGEATCGQTESFYVLNHGWHTGLAIASRDLLQALPALAEDYGDGAFIELGWGDEAFYRAPTGTLGLGLKALFWSASAALHVAKVPGDPRSYFADSEVIEVTVAEEGYRRLLSFVAGAFARSPEGGLVALGPGTYGEGRFYQAKGTYHAFYTCNTWVAEAVATSGFPISPTLALTANSVISRLRAGAPAAAPCMSAR